MKYSDTYQLIIFPSLMWAYPVMLDHLNQGTKNTIYPFWLTWVAQIYYIITFLFFEREHSFTILTHNGGV